MADQKNIIEEIEVKDEDYITGGVTNSSQADYSNCAQFPETQICPNGHYKAAFSNATVHTCNNCRHAIASSPEAKLVCCTAEKV